MLDKLGIIGILFDERAEFFEGAVTFYDDADFFMLVTSNVGAVIMSWMLYFQQSAVAAQCVKAAPASRDASDEIEAAERTGTLLGATLNGVDLSMGTRADPPPHQRRARPRQKVGQECPS